MKESEERYRTAIEYSNDGVAIVKGSTHLYVNQRFCDMFGFDSPDEVIGRGHEKTIDPEDLERVRDINQRRHSGEKRHPINTSSEAEGRTEPHLRGGVGHGHHVPRRTGHPGIPEGRHGTQTGSGRPEGQRNEVHAISENASDAIFLMDRFAIVDCNRKALSMFGADKENIVAHSPHMLSPASRKLRRKQVEGKGREDQGGFTGEPQFFPGATGASTEPISIPRSASIPSTSRERSTCWR